MRRYVVSLDQVLPGEKADAFDSCWHRTAHDARVVANDMADMTGGHLCIYEVKADKRTVVRFVKTEASNEKS
jgi:hypothetical protein